MGKVSTGFSMSLDGFIAGPNDEVERVFAWMSQGDTEYKLSMGHTETSLRISEQSARLLEEAITSAGAVVTGRRLFDMTGGWGGTHPLHAPVVVVTHTAPLEWNKQGLPVTFVTDGVESAIAKAKQIAGDKKVVVVSSTIVQQCLKLGLLDEIHLDLVPVLLGEGIRLFDELGPVQIELENTRVNSAPGVTQLTFRVVK